MCLQRSDMKMIIELSRNLKVDSIMQQRMLWKGLCSLLYYFSFMRRTYVYRFVMLLLCLRFFQGRGAGAGIRS